MDWRILTAVTVLGAAATGLQPPAHADLIYQWSGECSSRTLAVEGSPDEDVPCTGSFRAQVRLLDSYVPGTAFDETDIIQFEYADDFFDITRTTMDFEAASGTLPVDSGTATTVFNWNSGVFRAEPDEWRLSQELTLGPLLSGYSAEGTVNEWQRLPEPTALQLLLLLSTGLLALRLRARSQ